MLVISCEHGGNEVPGPYVPLFCGLEAQLESHRGGDPGALQPARQMAAALDAPLHAVTTTRLLVDLNRSIGHPHLFSEATRRLPRAQRNEIVDRYYQPHRDLIESEIARGIASGRRVIHNASHSFTPALHGEERRADVAWLYDPRRAGERAFARTWMEAFARIRPAQGGASREAGRISGDGHARRHGRPRRRFRQMSGPLRRKLAAMSECPQEARCHSSGGSSLNTLRVPSSHCRVRASK